jgi:four helix bundle protein
MIDDGRISRFEELVVWQQARVVVKEIYEATQRGAFSRDFGLSHQIQRAAVSVPSNIAEGFERNNPAEFHQALSIAKGSCAEMRTQLYLALDLGYITGDEFRSLMERAETVGRLLGALRVTVARARDRKRAADRSPTRN